MASKKYTQIVTSTAFFTFVYFNGFHFDFYPWKYRSTSGYAIVFLTEYITTVGLHPYSDIEISSESKQEHTHKF